jgi:hypothetical protein
MQIISFIGFLISIINRALIPLIFAVAFLLFLWGILQFFFLNGENEEKRKEGRKFIIAGIIGFFIMMSIWGIVNILLGTFGFQYQSRPPLPSFSGAANGGGYGNANGQGPGPGTPVLGRDGRATIAPAQPCGLPGLPNACFFTNECIGGFCRSRSLDGGVGEACLGNACVNGYHCSGGRCIQDGQGAPLPTNSGTNGTDPNSGLCSPDHPENC